MSVVHQSQSKACSCSQRVRRDRGATKISIGLVWLAAYHVRAEAVDQAADHGNIRALLIGSDECVDRRVGKVDGISRQRLNGQKRAAHCDDRDIQPFPLKKPHLARDPERAVAQSFRGLADGKADFFLREARRTDKNSEYQESQNRTWPSRRFYNIHRLPSSHHSITPILHPHYSITPVLQRIGLITDNVFRPVHIGRKTEWRCLPPNTTTIISSGVVERCTIPSGVTLGDSLKSSSSLLWPLRRAGIFANGIDACSQRYCFTCALVIPSRAMISASSTPNATSGVPPPKLPTSM